MSSLRKTRAGAFCGEQSGGVAVLFGMSVIPVMLLMGGAVDFARYARYDAALSSTVDAAGLALGRQPGSISAAEAQSFLEDRVAALAFTDEAFTIDTVTVVEQENGYRIVALGTMQTMFLPMSTMTVTAAAEIVRASNRLELALVLDNTGSMNCGTTVSSACTGNWSNPGASSRIAGLKLAAQGLVDKLMADTVDDPGRIKIGIVPFEGTVNIGAAYAATPPAWVDWDDHASAKYSGRNLGGYDFGDGSLQRVGHKWLFDKLTAVDAAVKWEGCVEMRAGPNDLLDTPPVAGNTLFVPFFWGDEPDSDNDSGYTYQNDYLDDATTSNGAAAQTNVAKYTPAARHAAADTSFPFTSGPNYGCPRPILPLTGGKPAVDDALATMVAYPAMGTFIPLGLAWGWHILSAGEPFTQGVSAGSDHFGETVKAIVLLSDGENSVTGSTNHNKSIYNGYNYTNLQVDGAYRLGSSNAATATANLNAKTAALCTNVKAAGIRLYTVTFGTIPNAAKDLMRACASVRQGAELYYHAPSNAELNEVFAEIGDALNELHLSK